MSGGDPGDRRGSPQRYEEALELLTETLRVLARRHADDPEGYRELLDSSREDVEAIRALIRKHPRLFDDALARFGLVRLRRDELFRLSLEQMRRGERGAWPPGWNEGHDDAEPRS